MMTAQEAHREAGSPANAAKLSKRYSTLGQKALSNHEFGKAADFFQKASAFASALSIIAGLAKSGRPLY